MPYPGVPEHLTEKMERCVQDVMAQGHDKSSAIAICKAAIVGDVEGSTVLESGVTFEPVTGDESLELQANYGVTGRILRFKNAALAHATRNANGDGLTSEGLKELAETLPLMPIDVDHQRRNVMGVFTSARTRDWVRKDGVIIKDGELVTDGIIFADNYPVETAEVMNGERKLSIFARAKRVVCSVCHKSIQSVNDYCSHLKNIHATGATRYLFGLTAYGAATTKDPADADATFDTENGLVMIAMEVDMSSGKTRHWYNRYGIESETELDDGDFAWLSDAYRRGEESKTEGRKLPYKVHGDVKEDGWRAAWTRAHQMDARFFAGGPSKEAVINKLKRDKPQGVSISESVSRQRSDFWYMVRDSFRRWFKGGEADVIDVAEDYVVVDIGGVLYRTGYTLDSKGNVVFSDDTQEVRKLYLPVDSPYLSVLNHKEEQEMDESKETIEQLKAKVEELEGKNKELESKASEVETLKAQIEELRAKVENLTAEKEKLEAQVKDAQEKVAVAAKRSIDLAPVVGRERVEELLPKLADMDEETFNLIAEVAQKTGKPAQFALGDDKNKKDELTLENIFAE